MARSYRSGVRLDPEAYLRAVINQEVTAVSITTMTMPTIVVDIRRVGIAMSGLGRVIMYVAEPSGKYEHQKCGRGHMMKGP